MFSVCSHVVEPRADDLTWRPQLYFPC